MPFLPAIANFRFQRPYDFRILYAQSLPRTKMANIGLCSQSDLQFLVKSRQEFSETLIFQKQPIQQIVAISII